jgi:hypothetical protein
MEKEVPCRIVDSRWKRKCPAGLWTADGKGSALPDCGQQMEKECPAGFRNIIDKGGGIT